MPEAIAAMLCGVILAVLSHSALLANGPALACGLAIAGATLGVAGVVLSKSRPWLRIAALVLLGGTLFVAGMTLFLVVQMLARDLLG